ncbi:hypothetical protein [Rhodococcus qingshengii]|uniref:hypothetical protein n=1 Tax=Rhodococcus qingshengii TaxID=334542 RepID=UPI0035DAD141
MAVTDLIKVSIQGKGEYETTVHHLDEMMNRYLPASLPDLRKKIVVMSGEGCEGHYDTDEALLSGVGIGEAMYCDGMCNPYISHLTTISECLMVLAELHGHATN